MSNSCPQFERVVADYYDDVYRFALSLTGQECDAVDLTQNAFVKFAKKGSRIHDSQKVKSWLFTVLRNEFIDLKRKSIKFPSEELHPSLEMDTPSQDVLADSNSAVESLQSVPHPFREPLALYYLQGYTYPEIAKVLQIPIGTVMSRLSRGKTLLRKIYLTATPTHG